MSASKAVFLLVFLATGVPAALACPKDAPGFMTIAVQPSCISSAACPTRTTVSFTLVPLIPSGGIATPWTPIYEIQPCDTVTWNFGDGSQLDVKGSRYASHTFHDPANLVVTATITNSFGTATFTRSVIIADDPIRISVGTAEATEGGVAQLPLTRTGGMSRTGSLRVWLPYLPFSQTVTFSPGETNKSVAIPIPNDSMYEGTRNEYVYGFEPAGGVLLTGFGFAPLTIHDDEPQPVLSMEDLKIIEGDRESTVYMTLRLSGPIGRDFPQYVYAMPQTSPTTDENDFSPLSGHFFIPKGHLTARVELTIHGDSTPEPDETVNVELSQMFVNAAPKLERPIATCTIVNDDAVLDPPSQRLAAASRGSVELQFGTPLLAAQELKVRCDSDAVTFERVTVPSGADRATIPFLASRVGDCRMFAEVQAPYVVLRAEADIEVFSGGAPPAIESIVPASGPVAGGTRVRIAGSGFDHESVVTFDGIIAHVVDVTADAITVVTPPHASGAVDVIVMSPAGTATKAVGFTYAGRRRSVSH